MRGDAAAGVSFHGHSGGGETARLVRDKDWTASALGPNDGWPRSLKNYLGMIFELPTAAIIFWGPDQIQLYNDGYAVIMGPRHPRYLGATFRECWSEVYDTIHPWMRRVLESGETVEVNKALVPITRYGFPEEAYFTFSFSPLRDDQGAIAGILQIVTEVTAAVLADRRTALLHELSNQIAVAGTPKEATRLATDVLDKYSDDLPFARLYTVSPTDHKELTLAGSTGLAPGDESFPSEITLGSGGVGSIPELATVVFERKVIRSDNFVGLPITAADQQGVVAVLIAGISRRLPFDGHYQRFLELVSVQISTLLSAAHAREDERKRVEALAEIDRAKTEFFGNVSHEFRTPLTLILGPLEDALGDPAKMLRGDVLEAVHRNALRLLRLVNTLLDFARIEANRRASTFEPTDLCELTAGLAGSFQSLIESAGLKLRVECQAIAEPVYVDRAQWEKIVLNLVSNAFKFTFEGEIFVRLHESEGRIHLTVSDTGTGIPPEELSKIFERFHRVKGARGRSFEGTGIGLALVEDLTKRHGGSVRVESTVGKGTSFIVSIPKRIHPPSDDALKDRSSPSPSNRDSYLLEAALWNRGGKAQPPLSREPGASLEKTSPGAFEAAPAARILVVDDNADMRRYLGRLLSQSCSVETAEDGEAALAAALRRKPDLVLSDVMMPRMDGVSLLRALRENPQTSTIPVVLLSARAGEEALIGGFETGADDYLVKPFSARELLARVQTHLDMARLRREWTNELERANRELESFSYSVAHDLRAPLRSLDGFSQALLEDYADRLDAEGKKYLSFISEAARRMAKLIDGLLTLSRVTRSAIQNCEVDLTALAKETIQRLRHAEPTRKVDVEIEGGLVAVGDPTLVAAVLDNLIGNAWKFTKKKDDARVEFLRDGSSGAFVVRDNGAGFDMSYKEKLFGVFQRLHSQKEFEGTGIGLATVLRIVERHKGRVWAESSVNQGAAFFFTLPVQTGGQRLLLSQSPVFG